MPDNRPLSPHLQVYRWYFTMFLSILHRASGVGLSLGAPLMIWWLIAAVQGEESFARFHDFTHSLVGMVMLAGWLFAMVFHSLNGLRHLMWDTGAGLSKHGARNSGLVVFFGAIVVTAALWIWS
jgi:succinate dehydrogenase / fumarate reductase cytochrome b subunit